MDFGVTQLRVAQLQQMPVDCAGGSGPAEGEWSAASFVRQVMNVVEGSNFQEVTYKIDQFTVAVSLGFDWTNDFTMADLVAIKLAFRDANRHTGLTLVDIQFAGAGDRPDTLCVESVILGLPRVRYSASV